jgi:nitrite reductase (NADH) small subunit
MSTAMHDLELGDLDRGDASAQVYGTPDRWTPVCTLAELTPDRGVCALVGGGAVAVFLTSFDGAVRAIGNHDPFTDASVLSRGLVGWDGSDGALVPYVASPLRKHRFDLRTGRSLADPEVTAGTYPVRVADGVVEVGHPEPAGARSLRAVTLP